MYSCHDDNYGDDDDNDDEDDDDEDDDDDKRAQELSMRGNKIRRPSTKARS